MVDRRVMEKDDVALTGLRIKAARVLTSLNQECFAERFKFGYASVKNWELGRSIPRDDTVSKILDALHECGVQTTRDWLLFGLGSGPNHISEHDDNVCTSSFRIESLDFGHEIAQFERTCVKNNIKPIVVSVADDLMQPFFFKGDIIGAESIELRALTSHYKTLVEYPFLVEVLPNVFQPRFLASGIDGAVKFWRTYQNSVVGELKHLCLGKIIWFRRPSRNVVSQ